MNAPEKPLVTVAVPGKVKVITARAPDGRYESFVRGGLLDGDRFFCEDDPEAQHVGAVELARQAEQAGR